MNELRRVSSEQLYLMWKNLSIGLLTIIAVTSFSKLLPYYLSPVISLIGAAALYTLLYNHKVNRSNSCMLVPYSIFFCLIAYSFVTIVINVLFAWGIIFLPREVIFFSDPYVPSLVLAPVSFVTMLIIYIRRHKLQICSDCKLHSGNTRERGKLGSILSYESSLQIKNLLILFGVITLVTWGYYLIFYVNININARDWYVFMWLVVLAFVFDEVYFIYRYYNLYLDLKENNEIITPEEIRDISARTYLRFYMICGNYLYLDNKIVDPHTPYKQVIDTPFETKRSVNGITIPEVRTIIERMTNIKNGDLRFFYGRKLADLNHSSLLRYFYFLDGDIADYQEIRVNGVWMDFEDIKKIYSRNPGRLASTWVADLTRLATIMLTQKVFDNEGNRISKLKSYNPSFNLVEVRNSDIDFQDDKWIQISLFNSDTKMYHFKKWMRRLFGKADKSSLLG